MLRNGGAVGLDQGESVVIVMATAEVMLAVVLIEHWYRQPSMRNPTLLRFQGDIPLE